MARTRGSVGAETEKAIRKAAIALIAKHGFEAMTLRDLADHVGLQPGSIYRYIATKDQLLVDIMAEHMEALIAAWRGRMTATADPRLGQARELRRIPYPLSFRAPEGSGHRQSGIAQPDPRCAPRHRGLAQDL